jgi:hypothetical protein
MTMTKLPESLFAAHEWTAAAGELPELRRLTGATLDTYCAESEENARLHDVTDVTASDLHDLHDWLRSEAIERMGTTRDTRDRAAREEDGMAKIEILTVPAFWNLADAGWDADALGGEAYGTKRAKALYAALGVSESDEEYALCQNQAGRWALVGLQVEGYRYAAEREEDASSAHDPP